MAFRPANPATVSTSAIQKSLSSESQVHLPPKSQHTTELEGPCGASVEVSAVHPKLLDLPREIIIMILSRVKFSEINFTSLTRTCNGFRNLMTYYQRSSIKSVARQQYRVHSGIMNIDDMTPSRLHILKRNHFEISNQVNAFFQCCPGDAIQHPSITTGAARRSFLPAAKYPRSLDPKRTFPAEDMQILNLVEEKLRPSSKRDILFIGLSLFRAVATLSGLVEQQKRFFATLPGPLALFMRYTGTKIAQNLMTKGYWGHTLSRMAIEECLSGINHFAFHLILRGHSQRWPNSREPGPSYTHHRYCLAIWIDTANSEDLMFDETRLPERRHQHLTDRIRRCYGLDKVNDWGVLDPECSTVLGERLIHKLLKGTVKGSLDVGVQPGALGSTMLL